MNVFLAIVLASLVARLGYQMARSPVLPAFAADLGAGPELLGVIVAASTITGVFFKLPAGTLSDMLGRKRMMVIGALFFAFPPFAYPFVSDPYALLSLRFVHGFATAIFSPVAAAYVAGLREEGRGARLGWFASANDFGATAGPMVGGLLLYFTASFEITFMVVGILGLATLAIVLLLPELEPARVREQKSLSRRAAEFGRNITQVLSVPPILTAAAIEAIMYFGYAAFLGFLPIYAALMGLNNAEIALVLGAQLVAAMIVKPFAGRVSDAIGRKPVIVVGLLLSVAALPLIFRSDSFFGFAAFSALLGLGVGIVTPVTNALIADLASVRRLGTAMGVFGTVFDVGEAAGPIVAGFLVGALGYERSFDIIAIVTFIGAVTFAYFVREPRRREPEEKRAQ
jgi:MFS transporter, DHA1 family, multidrug resistance protein